MDDGLGGGSGAVATRPERRPRDQDRRGGHEAALPFPSGLVPLSHYREMVMAETNRRGMNKPGQPSSMGLVIRQKEPKNLETHFGQVDSFLTPTELFYIRSCGPTTHRLVRSVFQPPLHHPLECLREPTAAALSGVG